MNAALRALFDSIAMDLVDDGARAPGVALVALGGYGAGELAPRSDVDLLFLAADDPPSWAERAIERTLYALWDCGLTVGGGAVRTVDEALALAREDVSERTALLDLRSLTGDLSLVRALLTRFDLDAEQFVYGVAHQQTVDVVVTVTGPDGAEILSVDGPAVGAGANLTFLRIWGTGSNGRPTSLAGLPDCWMTARTCRAAISPSPVVT